jgi:hypothetical protein
MCRPSTWMVDHTTTCPWLGGRAPQAPIGDGHQDGDNGLLAERLQFDALAPIGARLVGRFFQ